MSGQLRAVGEHRVIEIPRLPDYKGTFAKVYFGHFDKRNVAVKKVDEDDKYSKKELEYLREFQHENIVRYLFMDTDETDASFYIVLEKCDCTLREFINRKEHTIPPLEILWPLTTGLAYLHEKKKLVHRDLKPCNILMIQKDSHWIPKISDFGISKTIDRNKTKVTQTGIKGTVGFMSPEALRNEKVDQRADIFSLGIIFYYVLSHGEHPFKSDELKLEFDIREGKVSPEIDDLEMDAKSLVQAMIAHDRESRPKILEVMAHHLFWDGEKKMNFIQEVSDIVITDEYNPILAPILEAKQEYVVGGWRAVLYAESPIIEQVFEKMKNKKQNNGVCDLLRNIRNLKNHYKEKPDEFRSLLGEMPEGVMEFFTTRFSKLIPFVYEELRQKRVELGLEKYYIYKGHTGLNLSRSPPVPAVQSTGYNNLEECSTDKLILREYQKELAEKAIGGYNSLIIAPTGSGKTAVLAGIIENHITKSTTGCIIFLVPKTALAHQQYKFLQRYLPCSVDFIIGETAPTVPPGQKIQESKVTVLTPRILINELQRKDNERYVSFEDISLLLFDECHNANKKHDFKQILELFVDYKQQNNSNGFQIQIVGVTASPGIGRAKDRSKVKSNLLELMANLDVTTPPVTVKRNVEELKRHQNEISEYYVSVQTESEFGNEVVKVMTDIEDSVKMLNLRHNAEHLNKMPKNRSHQAYENWTEALKNHAKLNMSDEDSSRILFTYAEHLNMYNFLLQLKDLVPNAMTHANKMVKFLEEGFENRDLYAKNKALLLKAENVKVPMLVKLFSIIKEEFHTNEEARCIVFVKRKLTATSLEDCMKNDDELARLNAKCLMGTHGAGTDEVMTKVTQDAIIQAFSSGDTKIIIATSVAEEGIDIKKCNLVIMYNYVTGEVGRIQRKGRGRASGSRSILITSVGSDHTKQEKDNLICAQATDLAIKDVNAMSSSELQQEIKRIQDKDKAERKMILEMTQGKKGSPLDWEILCVKCKTFLTAADKLGHIDDVHIAVQDPGFHNRVSRIEQKSQKGPDIQGTADLVCGNPKCGTKVALEMVYHQSCYIILSFKRIILRNKDGKFLEPKKKKNLPFAVTRSVEDMEASESHSTDGNESFDNDDLMECFEINQIF